jgi:hypothetical protein
MMSFANEEINEVQRASDIAIGSELYNEVARGVVDLGINLAFFVFLTSKNSCYARSLEDGSSRAFPVLTLYLRFEDDFLQTGISAHLGNWGDGWAQTEPVRMLLNAALARHGYGDEYVSDRTIVFVYTLEELAFSQIAQECMPALADLVCREAPGVEVSEIFWTGNRTYQVIMKDKADYVRVKRKVKARVEKALPLLLKDADIDQYCRNYQTHIKFGYTGVNTFNFLR